VLILLVVVYVYTGTRQVIVKFTSKENRMTRSLSRRLTMMTIFYLSLAFVSFAGTEILKSAHVIDRINYWEFIEFQIMSEVIITAVSSTMLTGGLILDFVKPAPNITKPLNNQ